MLHRRTLLGGLLTALATPAIVRTPGLLMPVRPLRGLVGPNWRDYVEEAFRASRADGDIFTSVGPAYLTPPGRPCLTLSA